MTAKTEQSVSVPRLVLDEYRLQATAVHRDLPGWEIDLVMTSDGAVESVALHPRRRRGRPKELEPAPAGGVTTTLLRRLPLGEIVTAVRAKVAANAQRQSRNVERFEDPDLRAFYRRAASAGERLSKRPGRAGRSDLYYAEVAADYVRLLVSDPTPVETLRKRMNLSASQLRNVLYAARERDLLTKALPGRAGGRLTPKAIALLEGGNHGQR